MLVCNTQTLCVVNLMLSNRAVCTFKECSDSSPFISAVWPPCAWPTRSWRLTGKWRRRKSKAWEERRRSRRKGWAWALATEGSSIRAALHTICQKPSCLWEYVTDKKTKKTSSSLLCCPARCPILWCRTCRWSSRRPRLEQSPLHVPSLTCLMSQGSPLDLPSTPEKPE